MCWIRQWLQYRCEGTEPWVDAELTERDSIAFDLLRTDTNLESCSVFGQFKAHYAFETTAGRNLACCQSKTFPTTSDAMRGYHSLREMHDYGVG